MSLYNVLLASGLAVFVIAVGLLTHPHARIVGHAVALVLFVVAALAAAGVVA